MKIGELFNGLRIMITNEQKDLIDALKESEIIAREDLDERQQRLAEQMTGLGLIDRVYDDQTESIVYRLFRR
jgi:hypothetical protein